MDLAFSQPGQLLSTPVGHQPAPATSATCLCPAFDSGQTVSGLSGKAIGQRWCVACRPGDSADGKYVAVPNGLPSDLQQAPEPETNDGDGAWQVVTRRRSRHKKQPSPAGNARVTNGASRRQLPENRSADTGRPQQVSKPVSPSAMTSCSYWPQCVRSFARLCKVDWNFFLAICRERQQAKITEDHFLRFHHMMAKGLQGIRETGDTVVLVSPFRVLLCDDGLLPHVIVLSLTVELIVPGFLKTVGERLIFRLCGLDLKHADLFAVIAGLLTQLCRDDACWLDRLGWQALSKRLRCSLFASMAFIFKSENRSDLVRSLHRQVSGAWLEAYHYATVEQLSHDTPHTDSQTLLRDLRESMRAIFFWLEGRFFLLPETGDRRSLMVSYAGIIEGIIKVMEGLDLEPRQLRFAVWQAVAQSLFRFRVHLSSYLGIDQTIALLNEGLRYIQHWPDLEKLAFELRLTLLGIVLMNCEELSFRRDLNPFFRTWSQYEGMLEPLLAKCHQFMGSYEPPFVTNNDSAHARRKEEARLNLLLRELKFYRLSCESKKSNRQKVLEHLAKCRIAYNKGWKWSDHHREVGTIELAKWCFLAGEHDAGVSALTKICFKHVKLSGKKADLLARHGVYHVAVAELHHTKELMRELGENDRRKQDEVDNNIAMTQLQWFQAGGGTGHLIEAYRLSVDLLGRCDVRDRKTFEGVLSHIVNAMKFSGLRFADYVEQTSVLGYLVDDGCGIKSWRHFANLLYIRHKLGFTDAGVVNKVASQVGGYHARFMEMGKKS